MKNKLLATIITILFFVILFVIPIAVMYFPIILVLIGIVATISSIWYAIYLELESENDE